MKGKEFLGHLAGLRGLAIILVILFHMDGAVWSHGYLGVDVFLVITGYLLFRSRLAETEPTSMVAGFRFLWRRVQRIVLPMVVTILLTATAGLLFLWWMDAQFCGELGFYACLGTANTVLKRRFEDYFAADAAFVPMLHLWYLSVTLQVYVLYAVGNQLLQRLPKRIICTVLALLGVGSLVYCYHAPLLEWLGGLGLPVKEGKAVSYYQTLPRVWEVLAGGLVCILPAAKRATQATLYTLVGLLLILLPALAGTVPGLGAIAQLPCTLPVVAGSVLTLRYAPESRLHGLLSNKVMVWLGGISFSLYLVHMPVIVYMRMWVFGEASWGCEALMLLVSVALAVVFYHGVEKRRAAWWVLLPLWGATLLYCREMRHSGGFREYVPISYWEMPTYEDWRLCEDPEMTRGMTRKQYPFFEGAFRFMNQLSAIPDNMEVPLLAMGDSSKKPTCLLIGDSHAAHDYAGLDSVLRKLGISGVYLASYIYPLYGNKKNKKSDTVDEQALMKWLEEHAGITHVIIDQLWWDHLTREGIKKGAAELKAFLQALIARGKKVVLMGPGPEFGLKGSKFIRYDKIFRLRGIELELTDSADLVCTRERYLAKNRVVLPVLQRLRDEGLCSLMEPLTVLAPGESFHAISGRTMLMSDTHHLGVGQSLKIMHGLEDALRKALQPQPEEKQMP